jgi:opacity protein-like surface antigen
MRHALAAAIVAVWLSGPALAADSDVVVQAQASAKAWLALVDAASYAESWDQAAAFFKSAVAKPDWEKAVRGARAPLGAIKSRQVKSATFTRTLPGAPDGEYVVILFDTQFAGKAAAVETVTPMREADGSWKVAGYYVR